MRLRCLSTPGTTPTAVARRSLTDTPHTPSDCARPRTSWLDNRHNLSSYRQLGRSPRRTESRTMPRRRLRKNHWGNRCSSPALARCRCRPRTCRTSWTTSPLRLWRIPPGSRRRRRLCCSRCTRCDAGLQGGYDNKCVVGWVDTCRCALCCALRADLRPQLDATSIASHTGAVAPHRPGGHPSHSSQVGLPAALWYMPTSHNEQLVGGGLEREKCAAGHKSQAAFARTAVNWPAAHPAQLVSPPNP